jgi:hypothetical protein
MFVFSRRLVSDEELEPVVRGYLAAYNVVYEIDKSGAGYTADARFRERVDQARQQAGQPEEALTSRRVSWSVHTVTHRLLEALCLPRPPAKDFSPLTAAQLDKLEEGAKALRESTIISSTEYRLSGGAKGRADDLHYLNDLPRFRRAADVYVQLIDEVRRGASNPGRVGELLFGVFFAFSSSRDALTTLFERLVKSE